MLFRSKEVHENMGITNAQFTAFVGHLATVLEKNAVAPDDVKAVLGAVEATRKDIVEGKKLIPEPNGKVFPKQGSDKGKDEAPDPNLARVKGTVTVGSVPLTYGFITFVDQNGVRYSANIQKDGTFIFRKGFPPGEYTVLLENPPPPQPGEPGEKLSPKIPPRFTQAGTSDLRFTAVQGENKLNLVAK